MIDLTIFNAATGAILRSIRVLEDQDEILANVADGESAVLGAFSSEDFYIKGGVAIPKPPRPNNHMTFDLVAEQWVDARSEAEIERHKLEAIRVERDRRLAADFQFQGVMYQRDQVSLSRITGAATLAGFAIGAGAQPGDFRWHGGPTDFAWIASDNSLTIMDAFTCFAFGQEAAAVETRIVFAAKALREMNPIPADYAADHHWP